MIKPWWVWAFWVSPLSYAQGAISVNEFTAKRWTEVKSLNEMISGRTQIGNDVIFLLADKSFVCVY